MVTTTQADTRAAVPESLWRHRNFLLLWTGQTVSETGSAVTTVAIPLIAIAVLKASTFEVGLLAAATYVAFSLIALPAGVVVDRLAKRKIMMWTLFRARSMALRTSRTRLVTPVDVSLCTTQTALML